MADKPKIGDGHVGGMLRLGLDELRAVSFWDGSNVAQPTPFGVVDRPTPGEVAAERPAPAAEPEHELERER